MCSDRRRNHGCGKEKPEGTSSAILGVGTAAKYDVRNEFAAEHHDKDVVEGKFS